MDTYGNGNLHIQNGVALVHLQVDGITSTLEEESFVEVLSEGFAVLKRVGSLGVMFQFT